MVEGHSALLGGDDASGIELESALVCLDGNGDGLEKNRQCQRISRGAWRAWGDEEKGGVGSRPAG